MNIPANHMIVTVPFEVETFQMDFLSAEMCPATAQLSFSHHTVAVIEGICAATKDMPVKALYLDHTAIEFSLTYFNKNGEEVNVEEQMELRLKLCVSPAHLQVILCADDTEITDTEGEYFTCTGEFFGGVDLIEMKDKLAEQAI